MCITGTCGVLFLQVAMGLLRVQAVNIPCTSCTEVWRGEKESLDVDRILALSCGPIGVEVIKSTIEHERAGIEYFAKGPF